MPYDKELRMKKELKSKVVLLVSISILLASLTITLCDALVPLNIWVHPILTFLFCLLVGFGVMLFVLAFLCRSPFYFFLSAVFSGFALFYALVNCTKWWLGIIAVLVLWSIFACLSFLLNGNKTESIALNKSDDYKDYQTRKAEKEAAEKEEGEKKNELPKIKSFK